MVNFRRSKKFGPFRLTASKSGLGISAGAGPLRVSRSPKGRYSRTVRVPGTGIYDTRSVSSNASRRTGPRTSSARAGGVAQGAAPGKASPAGSGNQGKNTGCGCAVLAAVVGGLLFLLAQCGESDDAPVTPPATSTTSSSPTWTTTRSTPTTTAPSTSASTSASTTGAPATEVPVTGQGSNDNAVPLYPNDDDSRRVPLYEPAPQPAAPPIAASFSSCREARAAGAAPLYIGQPGYSPKLDRDGDGVACE